MKKNIIIALGIAFALICGIGIGSTMTEPKEVVVEKEAELVTIEEAVTNHIAEAYPYSTIDNVNVVDIEKDEAYGGWKVIAYYDRDGELNYTHISSLSLDNFEL